MIGKGVGEGWIARLIAGLGVLVLLLAPLPVSAAGKGAALGEATPESVGFSSERLSRLDARMKAFVADGRVPGATVLVARHGKVVMFNAYGKADLVSGAPVTRDTIFRVYSQTKTVTGVAMMILFEQGKWRLDDPVTRFAPELAHLRVLKGVNADGSPILVDAERVPTMRELMTHSAGFGYGLSSGDPVDKAYAESGLFASKTNTEFLQTVGRLPLASQPGTEWRYSAAVDIQGYIVERISGQTLADFMQSRIFGPLKMKDTGFYVPAASLSRLATLYDVDGGHGRFKPPSGVLVHDYSQPPAIASGGAGLVSTTMDFARFSQMLVNGGELDGARILAPATVALMESNHLSDEIMANPKGGFSNHSGYGFGFDVAVALDPLKAGSLQGKGTVSWSGAAGTWYWVDPARDVIVVGMLQVMNRWSDPELVNLETETSTLIYQALVDPAR